VAEDRTEKSLRGFFESLTGEVRAGIQFVASDMWKPYLKVIAEQIPAAVHVLDRFHIMRNMNLAIDEVRRTEAARMKKDGYEPILTKARWCLLKRPENLTENQEIRKRCLAPNLGWHQIWVKWVKQPLHLAQIWCQAPFFLFQARRSFTTVPCTSVRRK